MAIRYEVTATYEKDKLLTISCPETKGNIGTQYDNEFWELHFNRPRENANDDLVLIFKDVSKEYAPLHLGGEDVYVVPNALTQTANITLQIGFARSGGQTIYSNVLDFNLRASLKGGSVIPEPWPDPVNKIVSEGFAGVDVEGQTLSFKNMAGKEVAKASIPGAVPADEIGSETAVTGIIDGKLLGVKNGKLAGMDMPSGGEADYLHKNYLLIGDSITSLTGDRSWVEKFKKLVLPANVYNLSVSGARWKETAENVLDGNPTSSANNTISNQVQKVINNQSTYQVPDIIIVFAGMNETTGGVINTAVESVFSTSDVVIPIDSLVRTNNVLASIRWSLEKLRGLYPLAQIFLVTHYQPAVYAGRPAATVKSVRDVMIAVGSRMSIPVIDLYATSGIDGANEVQSAAGRYLIDGLHPNAAGAELICRRIFDAVRSWYFGSL